LNDQEEKEIETHVCTFIAWQMSHVRFVVMSTFAFSKIIMVFTFGLYEAGDNKIL